MENSNTNILNSIFNSVNQWLFFAEKKNAMLIAFNGVSIFGILNLIDYVDISNSILVWILRISIIALLISLVICMISFVPKLKIRFKVQEKLEDSNVWYFNHIKTFSKTEYLKLLNIENPSKVELDLAEQIIQNAQIASNKYFLFEVAVWLCLSAFITPIMAAILFFYNKIN